MKLCEKRLPHDDAVKYARDLISRMSPAELARDFLYSIAHGAPEYRSALACFYYIKNLPCHEFRHYLIGQTLNSDGEWVDRYNESACEICLYDHGTRSEKKMDFWHINTDMYFFYFTAAIHRFDLNTAIIYLEEYRRLPRPAHSPDDYAVFESVLRLIEDSPDNTTPGKLRGIIRKSGLIKMSVDETDAFIDMLGYLNILHPDDCFGVTHGHTLLHNQKDGLSSRGYAAYPVNRWCGKYGVDRGSVSALFDGIYK